MELIKKQIQRSVVLKIDGDEYRIVAKDDLDYFYNMKVLLSAKSINYGFFDSIVFGDSIFSVTFVLKYHDGNPVKDVFVHLGEKNKNTNYDGVVVFDEIKEGEYDWEIKREGELIDGMEGTVLVNYNITIDSDTNIVPKKGSLILESNNPSITFNYPHGMNYFYSPKSLEIIASTKPTFWIIDNNNTNPIFNNSNKITIQITNNKLNRRLKAVY